MILDALERLETYSCLHENFAKVFAALSEMDLNELPDGRHEIGSNGCAYALVMESEGRGRTRAKLEAHRKYIDVQIVLSGEDIMGWRAVGSCAESEGYDAEKDVEFFTDKPATWLTVPEGHFCIFFPEDAHAPLAGEGKARKVIVKIAMSPC